MGTIIHRTITVTGSDYQELGRYIIAAQKMGLAVSNLVASPVNGYQSFVVATSGSKLGWPEQVNDNNMKDIFLGMLFENGIQFIDIEHGECETKIRNTNDTWRFKLKSEKTSPKIEQALLALGL